MYGIVTRLNGLLYILRGRPVVLANKSSYFLLLHWYQYNVIIYYLHLAVRREIQWVLVDTSY